MLRYVPRQGLNELRPWKTRGGVEVIHPLRRDTRKHHVDTQCFDPPAAGLRRVVFVLNEQYFQTVERANRFRDRPVQVFVEGNADAVVNDDDVEPAQVPGFGRISPQALEYPRARKVKNLMF